MATENNNNENNEIRKEDLLLSFFNALRDYKNDQDIDNLKVCLIKQAISNAYDDATRQGAFNAILYSSYGSNKDNEDLKNKAAYAKIAATNRLTIAILDLLDGKKEYKTWHEELCTESSSNAEIKQNESLMDIYRQLDKAFSVGNAQKWVNMSIKYIYVYATILGEMSDFSINNPFQRILDMKEDLHIPIDRIILKAVLHKDGREKIKGLLNKKEEFKRNYVYSEGAINSKAMELKGEYPKDKDNKIKPVAWSRINNYEDYKIIQKKIKSYKPDNEFPLDPLEWENKVWLASSGSAGKA